MSTDKIKEAFEEWYCDFQGISIDNLEEFLNYGNREVAIAFLAFEAGTRFNFKDELEKNK